MDRDKDWDTAPTPESVTRLAAFADAIVAIACTLLVLPVIDIEPPTHDETVWHVIDENSGIIFSFLLAFVITLSYWRRHHRMLDGLVSFTNGFVIINVFWLLIIVMFQFPAKMIGEADPSTGTSTLYMLYLALLAGVTFILGEYLRRHPELIGGRRPESPVHRRWSLITIGYFLVLALISLAMPTGSLYLLFGLVALGWAEAVDEKRRLRLGQIDEVADGPH